MRLNSKERRILFCKLVFGKQLSSFCKQFKTSINIHNGIVQSDFILRPDYHYTSISCTLRESLRTLNIFQTKITDFVEQIGYIYELSGEDNKHISNLISQRCAIKKIGNLERHLKKLNILLNIECQLSNEQFINKSI